MLDTPPLRKRQGPWPVKGRWAGKIFLFLPSRPHRKPFSLCQKGTEGRDDTYLYTEIGLYIYGRPPLRTPQIDYENIRLDARTTMETAFSGQ